MKKFSKVFKRFLICAVIAIPMICGSLSLDIFDKKNVPIVTGRALSSDPWNGRGSNMIPNTGFDESTVTGTSLPEPSTITTWFSKIDSAFSDGTRTSLDGYTTFETLVDAEISANFRKKDYVALGYGANKPGSSAGYPWLISNKYEFAFYSKMMSLVTSTIRAGEAYLLRPYFRLGTAENVGGVPKFSPATIDLADGRWITPYMYYTSNSYPRLNFTIGTARPIAYQGTYTNIINRVYFDGGDSIIRNAYVNQTSGSYISQPSVLGMFPHKSVVKNLTISNAFVTVPVDSNSTNEVAIASVPSGTEIAFDNIKITNSVVRGNRSLNGIANNASIIQNCQVENTTFALTPNTGGVFARGIGVAVEFKGNKVSGSNLETSMAGAYTWNVGIGQIRAITALTPSTYGDYGYDRENNGAWITDEGYRIYGGFFENEVLNTRIGTVGGTSYGHAAGIGYASAASPATFIGNKVKNCLVGIKTDNDVGSTTVYANGIAYISNSEVDVPIQISDNEVISTTVSAVTKQHTHYVNGMFYIGVDRSAELRRCYTENTDVIARISGSTGISYAYACGISGGYAALFEDCVTGSGNIDVRAVGGNVYAYGIGSTYGISSVTGPTLRKNWSNPEANDGAVGANLNASGWWDFTGDKGTYLGATPNTRFENCFNFSNVTTHTTGNIYAAGIGMGEGFTNCINYGNVVGNYVGGIALGFTNNAGSADTDPGTAAGNSYTASGTMHPLIIRNCANYGNLIRAANNVTSYLGGIFSIYNQTWNYRKERAENNGWIDTKFNLDGKHLEVSNCISDGKFFFYDSKEVGNGEYEWFLTDDYNSLKHNLNYWGMIFGYLNLNPYGFHTTTWHQMTADEDMNVLFNEFIGSDNTNPIESASNKNRFKIFDNYYNKNNEFDFMSVQGISPNYFFSENGTGVTSVAGYGAAGAAGSVNNSNIRAWSGLDHVTNLQSTTWRVTVFGPSTSTQTVRPEFIPINPQPSGPFDFVSTPASIPSICTWSALVKGWGIDSYTGYSEISNLHASEIWNTESGVPQIAHASYPFHIVAYNRNTAEKGYVPNVSIKRFDDTTPFRIGNFKDGEVGVTVDSWNNRGLAESYPAGSNQIIARKSVTAPKAGNLPITMLFANNQARVYSVVHVSNDSEYTYTSGATNVVKSTPSAQKFLDLTVTYANSSAEVTAVVWSAKVNGVWREILATDAFQTVTEGHVYRHTLNSEITEWFILNFADGNTFEIKAEFVIIKIQSISFEIDSIIDDSASLSVNLASYDGTTVLKFIETSTITLTATYDTVLYEFDEFIITDPSNSFVVSGGSLSLSSVAITNLGQITNITFRLTPRKYDVVIQTYAIAPGGSRVQLEKDLVETASSDLAEKAFIDSQISGLQVKYRYEDVDAKCFYQFVRWEYIGGGSISGGNISGTINFTSELIKGNNLRDTNYGRAFVVVAIFQRQVKLVVNMNRPGYENDYTNSYVVYDANGVVSEDITGGYVVNENTFLEIKLIPDTRLQISIINGVAAAQRPGFVPSTNTLYLSFDVMYELDVVLSPRPATINLFNKTVYEPVAEGGLGIVALGGSGTSFLIDPENLGSSYYINYYEGALGSNFRYIGLGLKYAGSNDFKYVDFSASSQFNLADWINDNFFMDFIDSDGTGQIWLFVARTYVIEIDARFQHANFTMSSQSKTPDGSGKFNFIFNYSDTIDTGSFRITFNGVEDSVFYNNVSKKFIVDYGTTLRYSNVVNSDYYSLTRIVGINADETITVTSPAVYMVVFSLEAFDFTVSAAGGIIISSSHNEIQLDSLVTVSFTAPNGFVVNGIKNINGKTLVSIFGAGNYTYLAGDVSITFTVTISMLNSIAAVLGQPVQLAFDFDVTRPTVDISFVLPESLDYQRGKTTTVGDVVTLEYMDRLGNKVLIILKGVPGANQAAIIRDEVNGLKFRVQGGSTVEYVYTPSKYHSGIEVAGLNSSGATTVEGSTTYTITRFTLKEFKLDLASNAGGQVIIDNATSSFYLDSRITISYTVLPAYRINGLTINDSSLETLFGSENTVWQGNSLSFIANEDFFDRMHGYVDFNGKEAEINLVFDITVVRHQITLTLTEHFKLVESGIIVNGDKTTVKYVDGTGNSLVVVFQGEVGKSASSDFIFTVKHGSTISYSYTRSEYSSEIETTLDVATNTAFTLNSAHMFSFTFPYISFTLEINKSGSGKANARLSGETEEGYVFSIVTPVIEINLDPANLQQVKGVKIGEKSITELRAAGLVITLSSNKQTVYIKVNSAFLNYFGASFTNRHITLDIQPETSTASWFIGTMAGGSGVLLLLALLIVFLVIRSKRIAEERKKAEAKVREYEQKFNIGGMISKLREDPMEYENSMKQAGKSAAKTPVPKPAVVSVPKSVPTPVAAIPSLSGCTILPDKTIVDKNKKKVAELRSDHSIVDTNGKQFAKASIDSGKITDNNNMLIGTVQGDGSIK